MQNTFFTLNNAQNSFKNKHLEIENLFFLVYFHENVTRAQHKYGTLKSIDLFS